MATHETYVERADPGDSLASGVLASILVVLLVAILTLFLAFGGPGRFLAGPTPPTTIGDTPAQTVPRGQPPVGSQIETPRQIDVTGNQPPAQPPSGQQAPAIRGGS
jgi:hypothetical protein